MFLFLLKQFDNIQKFTSLIWIYNHASKALVARAQDDMETTETKYLGERNLGLGAEPDSFNFKFTPVLRLYRT
jgi:hypothetical protein